MTVEPRLPLKRVMLSDSDLFQPQGGGSTPTIFGTVTTQVRNDVANKIASVATHFRATFATYPNSAAVAKVVLKDEALAKSHRPLQILERAGCPVVGVGGFGELFVSVRASTLSTLRHAVMTESSQRALANISTISSIEPFAVDEPQLEELVTKVNAEQSTPLKLRLFHHHDARADSAIKAALLAQTRVAGIEIEELSYARGLSIFRLRKVRPDHVRTLGRFIGTQSLGSFPSYHVVRPAAQPVGKLTAVHLPPPDPGVEYPIVGVVDTGVDPNNKLLAPWVVGREVFVAPQEMDHEHGTFVGGLVVNARALNHGDPRFPNAPCRILDVVALPKTGRIGEDELLAILREVVPKYQDVRVWNLSLAGNVPCSDHAFSDFAIALDEIQTDHDVTMVLASGNTSPPYRSWPPASGLGDSDRICGPADSARALTVGAVAHRESPSSCVAVSAPSPFSRRGPGPAYLPKPEVTHYGGNCDVGGAHAQMGVLSVDASGNLAESIGTSFASPSVAAILAHVQSAPSTEFSNLVAKALVIHSAALANGHLTTEDLQYRGFGIPSDPIQILGCDQWAATMIFEMELRAGVDLERTPFALPDCLRLESGAFRAEITATLAYEPALDGKFGAEYCRTNVDLSLGTYLLDKEQNRAHSRQVHPFPKRESNAQEKRLVENGFKWSPVKVYRRSMSRGIAGDQWRLAVMATDRSGASNVPTRVAMIVTIADIERKESVYNDVVVAMNRLGWQTADVTLKVAPRVRA
jgi:serine protease AprX